MRKHIYLVVEHENDDHLGRVSIYDSRFSRSEKNTTEPITIRDDEIKDFREVGRKVYLGYHDFADADDYEERIGDVIKQKMGEVDRSYVKDAGLDPDEVIA